MTYEGEYTAISGLDAVACIRDTLLTQEKKPVSVHAKNERRRRKAFKLNIPPKYFKLTVT